eukprot:m.126959 g.126959  ORF g.126959 m.126959 type:complete len:204 (+) comp14698_c0_seq1:172-783(+)
MRTNSTTSLTAGPVRLVPYQRFHVPKYHEWMKSEELQQLTASEPLSIEEEYEMQNSWLEDTNKCTFIVLDNAQLPTDRPATQSEEISAMIGDVNIFLNDPDDAHVGEIEVMIAEPAARGRRCGHAAVTAMMQYGARVLGIHKFVSKIGYANTASLSLFRGLGFTTTTRSDVFEEETLELAGPALAGAAWTAMTVHEYVRLDAE